MQNVKYGNLVDLVKSFLMSKNRLRHSRERASQSLEVIQVILSIHRDEAARGGLRVPGRYGVGVARRHRAPARIHDGIALINHSTKFMDSVDEFIDYMINLLRDEFRKCQTNLQNFFRIFEKNLVAFDGSL